MPPSPVSVKPVSVKILNSTQSLATNREYKIVCQSSGSRPDANISWYKGKKALKRSKELVVRNVTVSVLTFVPTVEDDGRLLGCRAENPKVSSLYLEQFQNISVHCEYIDWKIVFLPGVSIFFLRKLTFSACLC